MDIEDRLKIMGIFGTLYGLDLIGMDGVESAMEGMDRREFNVSWDYISVFEDE